MSKVCFCAMGVSVLRMDGMLPCYGGGCCSATTVTAVPRLRRCLLVSFLVYFIFTGPLRRWLTMTIAVFVYFLHCSATTVTAVSWLRWCLSVSLLFISFFFFHWSATAVAVLSFLFFNCSTAMVTAVPRLRRCLLVSCLLFWSCL